MNVLSLTYVADVLYQSVVKVLTSNTRRTMLGECLIRDFCHGLSCDRRLLKLITSIAVCNSISDGLGKVNKYHVYAVIGVCNITCKIQTKRTCGVLIIIPTTVSYTYVRECIC